MKSAAILLLGASLALTSAAMAQERSGERREAGAHVHGAANLAVAVDGSELTVELASPVYNLVGFERAPASDDEVAAWMTAARAVRDPAQIIALPPEAGCRLWRSSLGILGGTPPRVGDKAGEHDHGHDHGDGHGHDHGENHAFHDALLSWTFRCANIQAVTSFEARALRTFPRMTELDTVYLDDATQKSDVLTPLQARFRIR